MGEEVDSSVDSHLAEADNRRNFEEVCKAVSTVGRGDVRLNAYAL